MKIDFFPSFSNFHFQKPGNYLQYLLTKNYRRVESLEVLKTGYK
jgi:hypothetical protein